MRGRLGILLLLAAAFGSGGCAGPPAHPPHAAAAEGESLPGFRLVDVSRQAGLDVVQIGGAPTVDYIIESLGVGGAWLDYDGDGDEDLYLVQGATPRAPRDGPPDRLLRNDGDADGDGVPSFSDATAEAGLGDVLWGFGAAVADYDNDGDPDLYLTNWGPNRLYRNNGDGTFSEIAQAAGVSDPRWSVSAAWSDVDRDGDLDLYVTNYVEFEFARYPARGQRFADGEPPCMWRGIEVYCGPRMLEPARDAFFRNDGDADGDGVPTFTDATDAAGLGTEEPYFGLAVRFIDYDGDGDDDLYVANDSVQNAFFVNRGDGTFRETSILAGLAYNDQGMEQAGMGITAGDYDGDGRLDIAVSNFSHDHDTLYRNEGDDLFADVSYPAGLGTPSFLRLGWGIRFIDVDQDGWEDLVVPYGHVYPQVDEQERGTRFRERNGLYRNLATGRFEEIGERAGPGMALVKSSRALLPVDIDGDGDLDLLFTNFNDTPDLLRNDGARGNWLQVRLQGSRSNRDGIGARVILSADGRRQIREVRREAGYAGSVPPVAHFGLGSAERVTRLEVRWPSGRVTVLDDVEPNRRLIVREEDGGRGTALGPRAAGGGQPAPGSSSRR